MDYEFGTVFDLNANHNATVSKDRTGIFDGEIFTITKETGETLKKWLDSGVDVELRNRLYKQYLERFDGDENKAREAMLNITGGRASRDWTEDDLQNLQNGLDSQAPNEEMINPVL